MFIRRLNIRNFHSNIKIKAAEATAVSTEVPNKVNLNLSTPSQSIYQNVKVDLVQVPGLVGEYGITAGHTPTISQMKPGVITVHFEREKKLEKYFTAGGFAFTHKNSTTDLTCVELVKLDDIDPTLAEKGLEKYKNMYETAPEGSKEKAEAKIAYETHQAMVYALTSK